VVAGFLNIFGRAVLAGVGLSAVGCAHAGVRWAVGTHSAPASPPPLRRDDERPALVLSISSLTPMASLMRTVAAGALTALGSAVQAGSRHNAWTAVCADRARAHARTKARSAADALARAIATTQDEERAALRRSNR
jgi:hypothetical protein